MTVSPKATGWRGQTAFTQRSEYHHRDQRRPIVPTPDHRRFDPLAAALIVVAVLLAVAGVEISAAIVGALL